MLFEKGGDLKGCKSLYGVISDAGKAALVRRKLCLQGALHILQ